MAGSERRAATSEAERLRALALAGKRMTQKTIAKEVFGDERYYARVARMCPSDRKRFIVLQVKTMSSHHARGG